MSFTVNLSGGGLLINRFNSSNMLKSTQEKLQRQQERDNKVAFFEAQKENLKNRKADTLEEISEKLEMFHNYENEIAAANQEYNNSQMFHVMDEAEEHGEKIAEAAERNNKFFFCIVKIIVINKDMYVANYVRCAISHCTNSHISYKVNERKRDKRPFRRFLNIF